MYFYAMLCGGMQESISSAPIEILDVSHASFLQVLEYLHTDRKPSCLSLEEEKELLVASNMFQLHRLKALCEVSIRQHISRETVISILLFSHHHQATDLKECAWVYMMQNLSESVVKNISLSSKKTQM